MKNLLIALLFIPLFCFSQDTKTPFAVTTPNPIAYRFAWSNNGIWIDSVVKFTKYATNDTTLFFTFDSNGKGIMRKVVSGTVVDSSVFATVFYIDTAKLTLRNQINFKFNTSDTANHWVGLGRSITINGVQQFLSQDIVYSFTRIDSSNYSDNSGLLGGNNPSYYIQTLSIPDSSHISISNGNYISVPWISSEVDPTVHDSLKRIDTALLSKIPYSDTTINVSTEYERKRDSLTAYMNNSLKLSLADTATVLSNYNKSLEKLGAFRNAKIYTCILRPSIDVGTGNITWRFLGWSDDHDTLHVASITVTGTYIQINFDTTCKRVLTCIATPDDDIGAAGVTVGCKGNLDNIQIYGSAPRGTWDGYFTWTGGTFTPQYAIQDLIFDSASVSPTYSFKITAPTPMNPNYGNGLSYTSNYSGQMYAKWSVQYMGTHGYTVSRINDNYNPIFTVLDAAGNKVPNTAFTSTDLFMVKTGMDRRFPMSWDHNVNNFITANSNIWLFAMMVTY